MSRSVSRILLILGLQSMWRRNNGSNQRFNAFCSVRKKLIYNCTIAFLVCSFSSVEAIDSDEMGSIERRKAELSKKRHDPLSLEDISYPADSIDSGFQVGTRKIDFENNVMYSQRKILLILGPQSSGKSTLISAILEKLPICRTINRKKIISEVNEKANKGYLRSILLKMKEITGKEINNLNQLYLFDEDDIEFSKRIIFVECKEELLKIISSEEFNNYILDSIFQAYASECRSFLSSDFVVIIDETEINSDINYEKFCFYLKDICARKLLIFNTLEQLLQKYIKRNNSFLRLLESQKNIQDFLTLLDDQEKESGNSCFTYRPLNGILDNYKKYFIFSPNPPNSKKPVLQVLHRSEMSKVLVKIIKWDQGFQSKLKKWDFFRRRFSAAPLQIETLIESLFGDSEKVYIESKLDFDYVIESQFDPFFTSEYLVEQLPDKLVHWLKEEIISH